MSKLSHWLLAHLPASLIVRTELWFLAVLCFLSGLVIVAGISHPDSVVALLWHPVYVAWGICLLIGSIALMAGLSSIKWAPGTDLYIVKRIPIYKLGLRLLGLSSTAYAVAIGYVGRWNGILAVGITAAFAATCLIRLLTLGRKS